MDAIFHDQLERELAEHEAPPLGSLVGDAMAAGRRLRWRRRLGLGASALGGAIAVAITATLAGSALATAPSTSAQPGASPVAESPQPSPGPTADAAEPGNLVGWTGEAIVAELTDLLPPGGDISDVEQSTDEFGATGGFTYVNGEQLGRIGLGVLIGPDPQRFPCHEGSSAACETTTDDGVTVTTRDLDPDDPAGDFRVDVGYPDDLIVFIEVSKTLLTAPEAVEIATDSSWSGG
jgi:hypothetical protein